MTTPRRPVRAPRLVTRVLAILVAVLALLLPAHAADEPVRMLVLKGNIEISFGQPSPLDETLVEKLAAAGIEVTELRDFHPLTLDYLKQFHVVAWIGITPYAAYSRYYGPTGWQGGTHNLTVAENAAVLEQYARAGGGLLLNPSVEEIGMSVVASQRQTLAPYGIDTICAQLRDPDHQMLHYEVLKKYPYYFHWTEQIADHPVAAGVSRVYYPGFTMRWDDNITALPLYPRDDAWTSVVRTEPTARVSWYRGTPYEDGHWQDATEPGEPAIVAVRDFDKGRVGAISISNFLLYYYPYGTKKNHAEILFGPQQGKLLETGDGETPSDLGALMVNLYRWLAEPARAAGFGRDAGIEAAPIPEQPIGNLADVWAERDPITTGPVRPLKILVGARSAASDGQGSVADWAAAARAAGYDMIAFTERFEATTPERYAAFAAECRELSTDDLVLLPGFDVADTRGNRFLLLGKEDYIRPHLLTTSEDQEPGDRLVSTGHMLIGMGEVLPVAARPAHMATTREKGALPPDLYSHTPGVAVATYRDGELVDDGLFAYEWHLFNATVPIPIAVHEVDAPSQVAQAATTGLQTMLNADSPAHAVHYFRQGHMSFGGNPMRYYVSSGPTVDSYQIDNWQASPWQVSIRARSSAPITQIEVRDQRQVYRRFQPNATEAEVAWQGDLGAQQWFITEIRDANGGRAIMSPVRTLPERNFVRCMDRQNWFSTTHFSVGISYTGRLHNLPLSGKLATRMSPPGIDLEQTPAPMLQLTYAGPGFVVVDYAFTHTLFPGEKRPGADNYPIFNAKPIETHAANQRYVFHMAVNQRQQRPQFAYSESTLTLKQDMDAPADAVWPVFTQAKAKEPLPYRYYDAATNSVVDGVQPTTGTVDLPGPVAIGGYLYFDDIRLGADGQVGLRATQATTGTTYTFRMAMAKPEHLDALPKLDAVIALSQGKLTDPTIVPAYAAADGGIAGTLDPAPLGESPWIQPNKDTSVTIAGLHPNRPVGLWLAADDSLQSFGILDGLARARLPINTASAFYLGNLLMADNPDLALAFDSEWTADTVTFHVHNPTDADITATVKTAPAITTRKALTREITVPAGQTVLVQE